ncbi:outer membrane protein OmpA-like peptidoglycan-associated protein [Roseivirga ehrenbergii]|nr:outer membrane protein OmpA-like peptidoglycan-associated protein [Roseivirga ehrenbergii]
MCVSTFMRIVFCTLLWVLCFTATYSQTTVQWASRVIDYSSEISELQGSAKQVLGKPNVLPAGGDNPSAWSPFNPNTVEFIKVQFDLEMPIEQIAIGETFNPGAIREVFLYDDDNKEYSVFKQNPGPVSESHRMFRIFLDKTPYNVKAVKIVIDGRSVDGFTAIDCIGVSNSQEPIEAKINLMPNINTKLMVYRLNDLVNSTNREIKPLMTKDKKTLYFSRRGHPENVGGEEDLEDIWYSDFDSTTLDWGLAKNIGDVLNNPDPNFISSFLQEDEELIILGNQYLPGGMKYGISKSQRISKTEWTKPNNLKIFNDINVHRNVNFWLTPDSEILLISEEGRGTEGGRDLYVSFLQKDGLWTEPLHMGPVINSAGEEEGQFLMPDKKTMFFTSEGHSGYGKKDIFVTRRLDNSWTSWTEPENLGPVINTEVDDMFLFIPHDGSFAYFCREVEGNDLDIHSLTLPLVTRQLRLVTLCGTIADPETGNPLDAEVVFSRLRDGVEVGRVRTDAAGNYCIELPADEIYSYRAEIPGFIPVGATIDLLDISEINVYAVTLDKLDLDSADLATGEPISVPNDIMKAVAIDLSLPQIKRDTFELLNAQRKELGQEPIESNALVSGVQAPIINVNAQVVKAAPGASFIIRNVFFDFDKDLLKPRSWTEIRNLAQFMNDYPTAIVELAGHTDNYGTLEYNIDLSRRRVEAVKKALATLGIKEDRLQFVWHGESEPITTNRTVMGRAINRRVEFTIISM